MVMYFRFGKTKEGKEMIEVWDDDTFIAGIYPHDGFITIVSKYLSNTMIDRKYPPALIVKFSKDIQLGIGG